MIAVLKKVLVSFSVVLNFLFILVTVFAILSQVQVFSFLSLDSGIQSAFIVSVPSTGSDLSFGPAEISLRVGDQASLQFAVIRGGRQSNLAMEPLYDHDVIHVQQTGFGLLISGISPGEAVLQLFSPEGFRTIARVIVY